MTRFRDLTVTAVGLLTIAGIWTLPLTWDPPTAGATPIQQIKRYSPPPSHGDCQEWQAWLDRGYVMTYNWVGSYWVLPTGRVIDSISRYECVDLYGYNGRVK
jgi:hypothetical protein